jgi:membrane-associated phospholipid phosphatase
VLSNAETQSVESGDAQPLPSNLSGDIAWLAAVALLTTVVLFFLSPLDLWISYSLADFRGSAFGYFVQEWGRTPATFLILAAGFVLATRSVRAGHPVAARACAALAAQVVLHPALLTNGLKLLTGRPRPVRIGPAGEGFTAFHELSPGFGDFSFPSGHVAVGMILAPWVVLLWREQRRLAAAGVAVLTLGWAGAVAFGRVGFGAHFPTDVVFSMGAGVALAPLSLRLGDIIARRMTRNIAGN